MQSAVKRKNRAFKTAPLMLSTWVLFRSIDVQHQDWDSSVDLDLM